MTQFDNTPLTAQDIQAIEQRAHAMRSAAMGNMLRAVVARIGGAVHKITALVHRPRHA
ncbi:MULTISPECIES: RSP_7527 family protein [Rhodobacterales]|jgi:hypothetical protein|uniref:Uncharacterized protein n=1 Tax=Phaeobacter gallaeciensis TaxID=60890 RepID=A0ABD4X4M9_9RHOB|nr:hypothetical protein [Phaeobacter gallaeciensis]MDF1770578.1 hypothetical protein [Pseudophaeobacter sp. bin_em_oilr2.035]MDE4143084.1 hypothetical protein [Phaeobacter gallaeciensis]MDE4156554.1 hypothetical protein [Phaeobacter gallaeciensis]MDE4160741.1 hypothetical protein [Phaeobacter gallaeciensis]MDE4164165.1 hypothetical protein [Phaeobacter gallaeciensis]